MKDNPARFNQPYSIIHLLPYSENRVLNDRNQKKTEMQLLQTIILVSILALKHFLKGNLTEFDAQVGENLCQIRAYKNIKVAKQWLDSEEKSKHLIGLMHKFSNYYKTLKQFILKWDLLIKQTKHYDAALDKSETIQEFLNKNELNFDLPEDIVYLIACFFLTYFSIRVENIPLAIDFKKIALKFNVSKHRAERLTHRYQLIVSKLGCDFILNLASELPFKEKYSRLLPTLYQLSDVDRTVLPCYLVSEIIFAHCLNEKIPVLILFNRIQVEQKEIVYFLLDGEQYITFTEDKPCLVILGDNLSTKKSSKDYLNYLNDLNPIELILANTATHPQYAGNRLSALSDNPFLSLFDKKDEDALFFSNRLEMLKELADKVGCSKQFPLEFFLRHIYASYLSVEFNRLQLMVETVIHSGLDLLNHKSMLRKNMWEAKAIAF